MKLVLPFLATFAILFGSAACVKPPRADAAPPLARAVASEAQGRGRAVARVGAVRAAARAVAGAVRRAGLRFNRRGLGLFGGLALANHVSLANTLASHAVRTRVIHRSVAFLTPSVALAPSYSYAPAVALSASYAAPSVAFAAEASAPACDGGASFAAAPAACGAAFSGYGGLSSGFLGIGHHRVRGVAFRRF